MDEGTALLGKTKHHQLPSFLDLLQVALSGQWTDEGKKQEADTKEDERAEGKHGSVERFHTHSSILPHKGENRSVA